MPLKADHNTSIKDYMKGTEKQLGKLKIMDTKNSKQTTKSTTMPKEAGANSGSKVKLVKSPKEDHAPYNEQHVNSNPKKGCINQKSS